MNRILFSERLLPFFTKRYEDQSSIDCGSISHSDSRALVEPLNKLFPVALKRVLSCYGALLMLGSSVSVKLMDSPSTSVYGNFIKHPLSRKSNNSSNLNLFKFRPARK